MKQYIFLTLLLVSNLFVFAQEIEFRQGTWDDMLRAAREENKMVFTDFYTSWCGPCKMMSKKIFKEKEVGDFYNKNFICYKLDAEKGEGKIVAKQYEIESFPTYLFVDGNGNVFYRLSGYMEGAEFIQNGQQALYEFNNNKKTLAAWDAEYLRKKNNPAFVRKYMEKRETRKLDNADILDQYFLIAKEKELLKPEFLKKLFDQDSRINAGGACFRFLTDHLSEITQLMEANDEELLYTLQDIVEGYSLEKAIQLKDENRLKTILEIDSFFVDHLDKNPVESKLLLLNNFYFGTDNAPAYEKNALELVDYYHSKRQETLAADSIQKEKFVLDLLANPSQLDSIMGVYNQWPVKLTPENFWRILQNIEENNSGILAFQLGEIVGQAVRISKNQEFLLQALSWAVESITLHEHFSTEEALAEILYTLGNKEEAIRWMQQARQHVIRDMDSADGFAKKMLDKIERMKNNLPLK